MTKEKFQVYGMKNNHRFSRFFRGKFMHYANVSKYKHKLLAKSVIYQIPIFSTSAGKRGLICITT